MDPRRQKLEKIKLERSNRNLKNMKVENYLKIKRVGVNALERKYLRE